MIPSRTYSDGGSDGNRYQYIEQAKTNSQDLDGQIRELRTSHWDSPKAFWAQVREVNEALRITRPLLREDRERLRLDLDSLCDAARRQAEQIRERSAQKREWIETKIHDVLDRAHQADSPDQLNQAKTVLDEALEMMKKGWRGFNPFDVALDVYIVLSGDEGRLLREDRDHCWELWKGASESIREKRTQLYGNNFDHFRSLASDALNAAHYDDPRHAKDMVKHVQAELKTTQMTQDQFESVRHLLEEAWEKASERQQEAYRELQERRAAWVERWRELIDKNEEVIARIEEDIDRCEDMAANAKSDDFADTVRGWIEEKYQKIQDIRESNRELESKARDVEAKVRV